MAGQRGLCKNRVIPEDWNALPIPKRPLEDGTNALLMVPNGTKATRHG